MMRSRNADIRKATLTNVLVAGIFLALIICAASAWFIFAGFRGDYRASILSESADHLIEINQQIKLYLEERFANEHRIAVSLANSINVYDRDDPEHILALLRRERDIWDISDIVIYTESGYGIGTDGKVKPNDEATDMIYRARREGEFMQIVQSTITYTLPVSNDVTINDSPMAAVSIVQELETLIDGMQFESFDGAAYIYLTQRNGAVISQLSHPQAQRTYNLLALIEHEGMTCITHGGHALGDSEWQDDACAFVLNGDKGDEFKYLITMPIDAKGAIIRMFYFVPESAVNSTMLGFSSDIARVSFAMIIVFTICILTAFVLLYKLRKQSFNSALVARERMFDLLVSNTRNAFALLSAGSREPLYISSNVEQIIGDKYLYLEKTDACMRMSSSSGKETEAVRAINQGLEAWDGKGEFISDFAPYDIGGITRYFVMRLYPVDDTGEEYIAVAQDVTGEREREEALRNALTIADTASFAKTRFLANMSHDIRTPMNVIINMTDFAIDAVGEPQKQMEYLCTIRDSSSHLLRLINDILDMSRIESGQVIMEHEPFDLLQCLDGICAMITPLIKKKEQVFISRLDGVATSRVIGDKLKLTRVIVNLLNNAVKFTQPGGHITFTAQELPSLRDNTASFRFIVEDDGEGIAKEYLSQIFEPFSRIESRESQQVEGSGLGLSICRSYVNTMGGTVSCASEPGKGSTFTVEVFFERDEVPAARQSSKAPDGETRFLGKRALLCEDHVVNQTIARMLLEKLGFLVTIAKDGGEAVRFFEASEPWYYDIVYMDIQMPVMNGYDATRAIRACARPDSGSVPIIAMTANVFAEDVERARIAGMNGHLGKPLMVDKLVEISRNAMAQYGRKRKQEEIP